MRNALRSPLGLAAVSVLLSLPALGLGFQLDDHFLRLALTRPALDPEWARAPADVFAFFTGDAAFTRHVRDEGTVPWWADDGLKLAFFRPLSGLTHGLDFRLWPSAPWVMHLHSLLWLGACVAMAAVLFRQLPMAAPAASLAALVFALDDGHGTPAAWIANRNALVGTFFGLAGLAAHDRWRRGGWRPGAVLAPVALLLGLLGGEIAVATGGYLLGYALFVDPSRWRSRLLALLPCTTVGVAWMLAYRGLGYGTAASALYVDPGASPLRFAAAFVRRAPILFFGQWALPADLNGLLSASAQQVFGWVALAVTVAVGLLLWPLLRRDAVARFFATGLVLSLVPAAATFPSNRLLLLASVGGAGLVGAWVTDVRRGAVWVPSRGAGRAALRVALGLAVLVHLVMAPLGLLGAAAGVRLLGDVTANAARTLPQDAPLRGQHLVVVTAPSAFLAAQSVLEHTLAGGPVPLRAHVLGSGTGRTRVSRVDERTLLVEPAGGYLAPPGSVGRDGAPPPIDQHHILGIFDHLYRDDPVEARTIRLAGLEVEPRDVAGGRPRAAAFRFARPLEDPGYRWVWWRDAGYAAFVPPPVGAAVELPAPAVWPR